MRVTGKGSLLLLLIVTHQLCSVGVNGHGWMVTPRPTGGGGTGSGNASTRNPCGKTTTKAITAEYAAGSTITVSYKRANNHGNTGQTVQFALSYSAADAAITQLNRNMFTPGVNGTVRLASPGGANTFTMDVTTNQEQTANLVLPNTPGNAVLQFHWQPTSGGNWYDCAYINIVVNGPCATNNGGCSGNATCSGDPAVCECKDNFFGDGRTCTLLPPPVSMQMWVADPTVSQDRFTNTVAKLTGIDVGRVLYDNATTTTNSTTVYFSLGAAQNGERAVGPASSLRDMVARGDTTLTDAFNLTVIAAQVDGVDAQPAAFGSDPTAGLRPNSSSHSVALGVTLAVFTALILAGVAYMSHIKRTNHPHFKKLGGSGSAKATKTLGDATPTESPAMVTPTMGSSSTPVSPADVTMQTTPQATAAPATTATTSTIPAAMAADGWVQYYTEDGVPYFYNETTGESKWEM